MGWHVSFPEGGAVCPGEMAKSKVVLMAWERVSALHVRVLDGNSSTLKQVATCVWLEERLRKAHTRIQSLQRGRDTECIINDAILCWKAEGGGSPFAIVTVLNEL